MLKALPVDTTIFCDMRLDDCEGSNAPYICPDATNSCTIATVPPGYAVYEMKQVQQLDSVGTLFALTWAIAMVMLTLIFWFKGKAVPEKAAPGPTHWSAYVVSGLVWINALVIVWLNLVYIA